MPQWHLQTSFLNDVWSVIYLRRRNSLLEIRQTLQSGSNSTPLQGNVQIPPSPGTMHSQIPRVCPGRCWSFNLPVHNYVRSSLVLDLAWCPSSKVQLYFHTFNLKPSLLSLGKLKEQAADQSRAFICAGSSFRNWLNVQDESTPLREPCVF